MTEFDLLHVHVHADYILECSLHLENVLSCKLHNII